METQMERQDWSKPNTVKLCRECTWNIVQPTDMSDMNRNTRTKAEPGDGLRSLRSTALFRAINFELYAKPNKAIMIFGVVTMLGCSAYLFYMNSDRKRNDYHAVVKSDDTVTLVKRSSRWSD